MGMEFTSCERAALCDLLSEETGDIIVRTDRDGFILESSCAFNRIGYDVSDMLIGPHLADLADDAFIDDLHDLVSTVAARRRGSQWKEFSAWTRSGERQWFALQLRPLMRESGELYGMIGILRSVEERRDLEHQLFVAAMTDPLTGLANRGAFLTMLRHLVEDNSGGTLAVFAVDHFRAINAKFGEALGDSVLSSFSDFLRSMLRHDHIIARIGSESFAVLMPQDDLAAARSIVRGLQGTLADISGPAGCYDIGITASSGLAPIACSADETLRSAELALFIAKQNGRSGLQVEGAVRRWPNDSLAAPMQHAA